MLADVLIFVPLIAKFHAEVLLKQIERAQIESLACLADFMISRELKKEMLENAAMFNVVLKREEGRALILSSEMQLPESPTHDMLNPGAAMFNIDALRH